MNDVSIHIYAHSEDLPKGLMEDDFFHSPQLFDMLEQTPRQSPRMLVATNADGRIVGQLLASVRWRRSLLPPYLYRHCHVIGKGNYEHVSGSEEEELFGLMLQAFTEQMGHGVLYIEVSHLPQKMYAYRQFRRAGYFPVRWMSIHNSLHSHTPEERISERMQQTIDNAYEKGVETVEVDSDADFKAFLKLLRKHNFMKPKRYIPADEFFRMLKESGGNGRLFLTRHRGHVIGCSACAYSQQNAYLWYAAFRRKSYVLLHPAELTIWHAIKDAHQRGYDHIFFMDVGLPFRRNRFRDFILRFGGKEVSTFRWFRCSIGWVNRLLSWFYRD